MFGAEGPSYDPASVKEWISHMKTHGIKRVCCLLSEEELEWYQVNLLNAYRSEFGEDNISSAPVKDLHLINRALLKNVLGFLKESNEKKKPVVVHCRGGLGRTGHVLSAWLVFHDGFSVAEALSTVENRGRIPRQAITLGNATQKQLCDLLRSCERVAEA